MRKLKYSVIRRKISNCSFLEDRFLYRFNRIKEKSILKQKLLWRKRSIAYKRMYLLIKKRLRCKNILTKSINKIYYKNSET